MSVRRAPVALPMVAVPRATDIFHKVLRQQSYAAQLQLTLARVTRKSPFVSEPISAINPWLKEYRENVAKLRGNRAVELNDELKAEVKRYKVLLDDLKRTLKSQHQQEMTQKIQELEAEAQNEKARATQSLKALEKIYGDMQTEKSRAENAAKDKYEQVEKQLTQANQGKSLAEKTVNTQNEQAKQLLDEVSTEEGKAVVKVEEALNILKNHNDALDKELSAMKSQNAPSTSSDVIADSDIRYEKTTKVYTGQI